MLSGLGHALFLLDNGRVFSWGNGGNGRLGLGDISDRTEVVVVDVVVIVFGIVVRNSIIIFSNISIILNYI